MENDFSQMTINAEAAVSDFFEEVFDDVFTKLWIELTDDQTHFFFRLAIEFVLLA